MRVPDDTSKDVGRHLMGAMIEGPDNFIENMEAEGQRQLVNSDVLPIDCGGDREKMEALGFVFGDSVDDLFMKATLPEGWSRKGSNHSMWSYIVDERGVERVGIFYKAAFYDRRADVSLTNVGGNLAAKIIYDDGPDETDWSILTDAERAEAVAYANHYLAQAAEHPSVYESTEKAEALKAKLS